MIFFSSNVIDDVSYICVILTITSQIPNKLGVVQFKFNKA